MPMDTGLPTISGARLKKYRKLTSGKYRRESGLLLVEGATLAAELIGADYSVEALLVDTARLESEKTIAALRAAKDAGVEVFGSSLKELAGLSSTRTPPAAIAVAAVPGWTDDDVVGNGPLVFLEGVQDPGNVGGILRTAAAFGVAGVYLSKGTCDLTNPRVVRASMGAVFRIPSIRKADFVEVFSDIRKRQYRIFGTSPLGGVDYRDVDFSGKCAFCFGSEARGLKDMDYDELLTIPLDNVESLNVGVALGVILSTL